MKKILITISSSLAFAIVLLCFVVFLPDFNKSSTDKTISTEPQIPTPTRISFVPHPSGELITPNEFDINIIPDKYSTGVISNNLKVIVPGEFDGITYALSGEDLALSLKKNKFSSDQITIKDCDFSNYYFRLYNASDVKAPLKIIFDNCKFYRFRSFEDGSSKVNIEFINCSFENCYTSNTTFNHCYFGGGILDGLVPYNNVYVNNCFFADKCRQNINDTSNVHTDGTQIYGSKNNGCSNIHYENCRFEMPILKNATNAVNACIMLQIEYSDAYDITFNNCFANGGGYSIYAIACKQGTIRDSSITNIRVGCSHKWGDIIHPNISPNITIDNLVETDALFVSSVWKDNHQTYISVTNDTDCARTLLVITNKGRQYFSIPTCYKYDDLPEEFTYSDLPFDIVYPLDSDIEWLVCYDVTNEFAKQIRCVAFSNIPIYIDLDEIDLKVSSNE